MTNTVKRQLDWVNIVFLLITPLISLVGVPIYVYLFGVHWMEILLLVGFYLVSGYGITVGYHRLFSHKTYEAHPLVKFFLLIAGAMAFQNSAYKWSSDHRTHHQFVDHDIDPYNAKKGFWYSHIVWVFLKEPEGRSYDNVVDLAKDKWVMWQHRYYVPLAIVCSFGIPTLIGLFFGRPGGFLLWAGVLRTVLVHHSTFFINSLAHICGKKNYDDRTTARDSWWLALFTFGEGYHNFHHKFQADYRNGVRWFHFDPSKWIIYLLSLFGLTRNLRRYPKETIVLTSLSMDMKRVEERLAAKVPDTTWQDIALRLEQARLNVEKNLNAWSKTAQIYFEEKRNQMASPNIGPEIKELKHRAKIQREEFRQSLRVWKQTVRFYLRQPAVS